MPPPRFPALPAALAPAAVLAVLAAAPALGAQRPAGGPPNADAAARPAPRVVAGEVVQAESGAPLEGATVVLAPAAAGALGGGPARGPFVAAARSAVTDAAGRYAFGDVPPGAYVLRVHRLGFRAATLEVELRGDGAGASRVSVGLTVVPIRLRPVEVGAAPPEPFARHARGAAAAGDARAAALRLRRSRYLSTDVREVTQADVADGLTLGETDLFRALQRLPGVSTRNDYTAELWARGARWDQTRVLWDGLPLHNPLHLGGLVAAVNADAVGAAFLHPGVRPAALGEGGAAVLDLRSRAGGGGGAVRGVGELSLISARAALDQQVAGGRGAWAVSGRRSYLDLLAPRLAAAADEEDDAAFPYHFAEVTARADWRLGGGRTVEASALRSQDHITGDFDGAAGTRARWGNTVARVTLAGAGRLGPLGAVDARHTLGVSAYEGVGRSGLPDSLARDAAGTPLPAGARLRAVRADLLYLSLAGEVAPAGGGAPAWAGGYELSLQRARTAGALRAAYSGDQLDTARLRVAAAVPQLALWAERRAHPAPRLTASVGLRAEAGPPVPGGGPAGAMRLAPRLAARYALGETLVSAALGRSYQYVQTAPATALGEMDRPITSNTMRPIPLWVPAGAALGGAPTPALRTSIATLGAERWAGAGWHLTANAYARRSAGLALDDPRPGVTLGRPLFVVGSERGRGVEVGVRKLTGRWTLGANYALAAARTTAAGLDFPSIQDRRHVAGATTLFRVGRGLRVGGAYTGTSGAPFTGGTAGRLGRDGTTGAVGWAQLPRVAAPGAGRLPAYARYDALLDWSGRIRRVRLGGFVQVHNLTQRTNVAGVPRGACVPGAGPPAAGSPESGGCFRGQWYDDLGVPLVPVVGLRTSF